MPNTSRTGGPLAPAEAPAPAEGDALDDLLQQLVVDLSGLDGASVRPRWQPVPPPQPKPDATWCAIGIAGQAGGFDAFQGRVSPEDDATMDFLRWEAVEALASFYGPAARTLASRFRDGLQLGQNLDALRAAGAGLTECGELRQVPELLNEQWLRRVDVPLSLSRVVRRAYPVATLASAPVSASKG